MERIHIADSRVAGVTAGGESLQADFYVLTLPFERVAAVAPELGIETNRFEHSPITGIHLWFDRPVTDLPHATLLDRNIQWMFNKSEGRYLQVVVSASRDLLDDGPRRGDRHRAAASCASFSPRRARRSWRRRT